MQLYAMLRAVQKETMELAGPRLVKNVIDKLGYWTEGCKASRIFSSVVKLVLKMWEDIYDGWCMQRRLTSMT